MHMRKHGGSQDDTGEKKGSTQQTTKGERWGGMHMHVPKSMVKEGPARGPSQGRIPQTHLLVGGWAPAICAVL